MLGPPQLGPLERGRLILGPLMLAGEPMQRADGEPPVPMRPLGLAQTMLRVPGGEGTTG